MTYSFLELFLINPSKYLQIKEIPDMNTNRCTFSLVSDTDVFFYVEFLVDFLPCRNSCSVFM